jgi:hypothetical protein
MVQPVGVCRGRGGGGGGKRRKQGGRIKGESNGDIGSCLRSNVLLARSRQPPNTAVDPVTVTLLNVLFFRVSGIVLSSTTAIPIPICTNTLPRRLVFRVFVPRFPLFVSIQAPTDLRVVPSISRPYVMNPALQRPPTRIVSGNHTEPDVIPVSLRCALLRSIYA